MNDLMYLRPQAIEIEEVVLGAILVDSKAILTAIKYLRDDDFYKPMHQEIYRSIMSLYSQQEAIDLVTVANGSKALGLIIDPVYLVGLTNKIGSAANIESHCKVLKEKSIRRNLIDQAIEIQKSSYSDAEDIFELINKVDLVLNEVRNMRTRNLKESNAEIIDNVLRRINSTSIGIDLTPIRKLNDILMPVEPGEVVLIAGRPGMGKSIMSTTIAKHLGINLKKHVILWGLELTNEQNMRRMLSNAGGIDHTLLKLGKADIDQLGIVSKNIIASRMEFIDVSGVTALDIRSKLIADKPDAALIDYGDLIRNMGKKSTVDEISETIILIKQTAKDLGIPIVLFWQLNRSVEDRTGHVPLLRDLRNSGALEQVASKIIFIYRPEYYDITTYTHENRDHDTKDLAVAMVAKNTEGLTGVCLMKFEPNYMRFSSWTESFQNYMPVYESKKDVPF